MPDKALRLKQNEPARPPLVEGNVFTVTRGTMNRRALLTLLGTGCLLPMLPGRLRADKAAADFEPLELPDAEWRRILTPDRYHILFEEGTERAFTSPLNKEYRDGTYICAACRLPLFESKHKYDSGTGWPSFTRPIAGHMDTKKDFKLFLPRTEYHCARCGGHQGHVFEDGPRPRGERWCNNGLALLFVPEGEPLPPLRSAS